jgi:hypothetical protein
MNRTAKAGPGRRVKSWSDDLISNLTLYPTAAGIALCFVSSIPIAFASRCDSDQASTRSFSVIHQQSSLVAPITAGSPLRKFTLPVFLMDPIERVIFSFGFENKSDLTPKSPRFEQFIHEMIKMIQLSGLPHDEWTRIVSNITELHHLLKSTESFASAFSFLHQAGSNQHGDVAVQLQLLHLFDHAFQKMKTMRFASVDDSENIFLNETPQLDAYSKNHKFKSGEAELPKQKIINELFNLPEEKSYLAYQNVPTALLTDEELLREVRSYHGRNLEVGALDHPILTGNKSDIFMDTNRAFLKTTQEKLQGKSPGESGDESQGKKLNTVLGSVYRLPFVDSHLGQIVSMNFPWFVTVFDWVPPKTQIASSNLQFLRTLPRIKNALEEYKRVLARDGKIYLLATEGTPREVFATHAEVAARLGLKVQYVKSPKHCGLILSSNDPQLNH